MNGNSVCYIACFYLGDRRCPVEGYKEDPLIFIKEHLSSLVEFSHSLTRIVFVFNLEDSHREIFESAKRIIPEKIRDSEVIIIPRKNVGMSYGAWSDVYSLYRDEFDYYIFNEDDYVVNQHNFDFYLVNKFNSFRNIGFLSAIATNPSENFPNLKTHAGNSFGITSSSILEEIFLKFGCLPHAGKNLSDPSQNYKLNEEEGQVLQTGEIFNLGYNIFDIREDYRVSHDMGLHEEPHKRHFDIYFHWNQEYLILPISMKIYPSYYYVLVTDPQYQKKKTCYISNFYFGERRRCIDQYSSDRLCFLKKHIEYLQKFYHNLDLIILNINVDESHYHLLNSAIKIIPDKIQNSKVEIHIRKNMGMSYGAFSEVFEKNKDDFDYFIFNEDDYFPCQNNWDEYLIRKYNSLPNSGYLCALQRDEDYWNNYKIHAGHCFGIASTRALNKVFENFGCLPHNNGDFSYEAQESAQIDFTNSFVQMGMRIYDIREEYRLAFSRTEPGTEDIWRWFWWNEKDLILPAHFAFSIPFHTWYECLDGPCVRKTNLEKYE